MDKRYAIFDMDGTLVDSMSYWKALGRDYLAGLGVRATAGQLEPIGPMTMLESAAYFMETFGVPGPAQRIVDEMHAVMDSHYRNDVPLKPGVKEYLEELRGRGVRMCVATATAEPLSHACLSRLGVDGCFDFILSCETIGVGKTRPDIYHLAAERLGAAPAETAVFEDAFYAVKTAKQAGFYTVGIYEPAYDKDWGRISALADETIFDWRNAP